MVRPIRIPQANVGLGGPAALPSLAAQVAPARASAELGRTIAGVAGDVVTRHNNLAFVREGAEAQAKLTAGIAGANETLDDYVRSPQYTDEGYAALREDLLGRAFEDTLGGVSNKQLRARLEGQRDGVLGADLTAELENNSLKQDGLSVGATGDAAVGFLNTLGPAGVPGVVADAGSVFDKLQQERPELRNLIQQERKRVFRAVQSTYLAGGAKGELQYQIGLSNGDFDALGLDVIGGAVQKAAERRADLIAEMAEASVLDSDYGALKDTGERFPGFSELPETLVLEALKLEAQGLDDLERDRLTRGLDVLIDRRERRATAMTAVADFNNEKRDGLPHLGQNPEYEAAYNEHFNQAVRPWLLNDAIPAGEKEAFLQRSLLSLGVVPRALQQFIGQELRTTNANPERLLAIANAVFSVSPAPLPGVKAPPGGQTLGAALDTSFLKGPEMDLLRFMHLNAGEGPGSAALAYENALNFQEAQRSGSSGDGRLSPTLDSAAAKAAAEADKDLRERISVVHGADVDVIGDNTLTRVREIATAEAHRLMGLAGTGLTEADAVEIGNDFAIRNVLDVDPPIRLFDRTFMSGPVYDLLEKGKYTSRMIEIELLDTFKQAGEDTTKGDLLNRFVLVQAAGLDPDNFNIIIKGTDDEPARFLKMSQEDGAPNAIAKFDGAESVQQKTMEGLRVAGMERVGGVLERQSKGAAARVHTDMIEAVFLNREDFIGRYAQGYEVLFDPDSPTTPPEIKESIEELQDRRNRIFGRVGKGRPLYETRPQLRKSWAKERAAKIRQLTSSRPGFMGPEVIKFAERSADKVIRLELQRELGDATVEQIIRFYETGLYPNEPGPGRQQLNRGPAPFEPVPFEPPLPGSIVDGTR